MSVCVIAAFLAFFPVAVGALRGLQSPSPASVELMRSLRRVVVADADQAAVPRAVPSLVPALKLAAALAVVGAVVAEISTGLAAASAAPSSSTAGPPPATRPRCTPPCSARPCSACCMSGLVVLIDLVLMRNRPQEAE